MYKRQDCGKPDCVALLEKLGERLEDTVRDACIDNVGVILKPKELLRDGLAILDGDELFETVTEILLDGVAVDEHDINNGLHDRVGDTDAGLLRDTL